MTIDWKERSVYKMFSEIIKTKLDQRWEKFKKKFDYEIFKKFVNKFEKQCVDQLVIIYSSFEEYQARKSHPLISRVIKAWLFDAYYG